MRSTSTPPAPPGDDDDRFSLDRQSSLYLRCDTPKGRGVFASAPIAAGSIVEISPVLVLSPTENALHIARTEVFHYTYNWPLPVSQTATASTPTTLSPPTPQSATQPPPPQTVPPLPLPRTTQAIVLGLGSMFNHSSRAQNVGWTRDVVRGVVVYRALREIAKDEELCISYGDRLTFVDADAGAGGEEEGDGNGREGEGFLGRIGLEMDD